MNRKPDIDKIKQIISEYKEVIKLVIIVILFHFFWKLSLNASDDDNIITFLTVNISRPFVLITNHLITITQYIISDLLGIETFRYNHQLYFDKSPGITIVWACSGVKQYLMTILVLLFAAGPWIKKLWYIPLSVFIMYILNIFRLVILTLVTRTHVEWFDFTHKVIFRGIIYGGLFLLWWLWVEKIGAKRKNPSSE